ncbi:hypothetical protein AAF712_014362 [Marasmius tenuissimus]|uniref:Uncharacterized protein n=1 Tax=Marasmius tenuissimus TaxID=585030 RepID=A0ABR2ZDC2_9AGAR
MKNNSLKAADHGHDARGTPDLILLLFTSIDGLCCIVWVLYRDGSRIFARCCACEHETDCTKREIQHCKEHERTSTHTQKLLDRQLADPTQPLLNALDQVETRSCSESSASPYIIPEIQRNLIDQGTLALLASLNAQFTPESPSSDNSPSVSSFTHGLSEHWIEQNTFGVYEDVPEPHNFAETDAEAIYNLTQTLLGMNEHSPLPEDSDTDSDSESTVTESESEDPNYFDHLQQHEEEEELGISVDESEPAADPGFK